MEITTVKTDRVQLGVRMEKNLVKVLKGLAEFNDETLGELLEKIVLHSFDPVPGDEGESCASPPQQTRPRGRRHASPDVRGVDRSACVSTVRPRACRPGNPLEPKDGRRPGRNLVALNAREWLHGPVPASEFLSQLHAGFATPQEVILELVATATGRSSRSGAPAIRLTRIVDGYDNEVYRADLADPGRLRHNAVYVRIRRNGEGTFAEEAQAMVWARESGVPVPEVIMVCELPTAADPSGPAGRRETARGVMIVAAATGRSLDTIVEALSPGQQDQVLTSLGRTLSQLHAVATPGWWRPNGGSWATAEQLRAGYIRERRTERDHLVRAGLTPSEVERTYAALDTFLDAHAAHLVRGPVLCHGDLHPRHVFVDDDLEVTTLIDWGMWHGGDPAGEFVGVWKSFGREALTPMLQAATRGHRPRAAPLEAGYERHLATTLVHQQIGHIAHHVIIGDSDGTAVDVAHLREALQRLDH